MKREILMHQRPDGLIVPGLPPTEEAKKKPKPKPKPRPKPYLVTATEGDLRDMLEQRRQAEQRG